jgi:membrane-associated phospholipid phosphatase
MPLTELSQFVAILDGLSELVRSLAAWDGNAVEAVEAMRWGPLTIVFLMASAWWVKMPLIAAVGACGDYRCRRRLPSGAIVALGAGALASLAVVGLKDYFERARPPVADPSLDPIGIIPESTSFPSGHAATAFAAAIAVSVIHPRLLKPLFALAALVALSRVYLGVHFVTDIVVGSALGVAIGLACGWAVRAGMRRVSHARD